jgi:hypothetical protein
VPQRLYFHSPAGGCIGTSLICVIARRAVRREIYD